MGLMSKFVERWMPDVADDVRDSQRTSLQRDYQEAAAGVLMAEGMSQTDAMVALEDQGWRRAGVNGGAGTGEPTPMSRAHTIAKGRLYSLLDPHAVAALRVWHNYTLGTGMNFKTEDATLQAKLEKFWAYSKNRSVTSATGQGKSNRRLLVDGEVFFALFPDDEVGAVIRRVEVSQMTHIISDTDDSEAPLLYRREIPNGASAPKVWYYRDWAYQDENLDDLKDPVTNQPLDQSLVQEGVVIYHLAFNSMFQRGNSLLTAALPWCSNNRQFMEDRAAITSGLAKFIRKLTVKGGKAQIDKAKEAVKTAVAVGGAGLLHTPEIARKAAQTFMSNDNVSMDDMPRTTGAGDARQDFRNGRLMIAAAVGMSEPYFGDAESGNLATATAMELPMLKQFQTHQELWVEAWQDMFSIVASFDDPVPVDVKVDMPPIVLDDVAKWGAAVGSIVAAMPECNVPAVQREALTQLNVDDVDNAMNDVKAKTKANADLAAKAAAAPVVKPGAPGVGNAGSKKLAESMASFFDELRESESEETE